MWQGEILAGIAGLCGGAVVAVALAAFIIELGIIHALQGLLIRRTTFSIRKLSDAWKLFGKSDLYLSSVLFLLEKFLQVLQGFSFGMFLWGLDYCLVEVVNVFA